MSPGEFSSVRNIWAVFTVVSSYTWSNLKLCLNNFITNPNIKLFSLRFQIGCGFQSDISLCIVHFECFLLCESVQTRLCVVGTPTDADCCSSSGKAVAEVTIRLVLQSTTLSVWSSDGEISFISPAICCLKPLPRAEQPSRLRNLLVQDRKIHVGGFESNVIRKRLQHPRGDGVLIIRVVLRVNEYDLGSTYNKLG